jgi:hypothetical protein
MATVRLFRHTPTGQWLPIVQDARERTPGAAYLPDLAREYGLQVADIAVVVQAELPTDLETNRVPSPPPPIPPAAKPSDVDRATKVTVEALLDLINEERAVRGKPAVTFDDLAKDKASR